MSTRTQRLANNFPAWTKARQDPSSLTQRWLRPFAKVVDSLSVEQVKRKEDRTLMSRALGWGALYKVLLEEQDIPEVQINPNGTRDWGDLTSVTGVQDGITRTLQPVETLEDLVWSVPDRLADVRTGTISSRLVYSKIDGVEVLADDYQEPFRLRVVVQNSTNYYRPTATRNPRASGFHRVIIEGRDVNYQLVTEALDIPDDGVYETANIFTQIQDVDTTGFDGDVLIYLYGAFDYLEDPYRLAVVDQAEGPLRLRIHSASGDVEEPYIQYFTAVIKDGELYRNGQDQLQDNEETQWEQHLQDDQGEYIVPVDLCIHPETGRLYALDDAGTVHVYEHGLSPFDPPSLGSSITLDQYLQLQPIQPWCLLGDTLKIFTSFSKMRYPILKVVIKRIDPSGVVQYLQSDKTWGAVLYEWDTSVHADVQDPARSWSDMGFDSTFDEEGQWEFYCTVTTRFDTTVSYVGVMVDALQALRSFSTDVQSPTCLFFNHKNELVLGYDGGFDVLHEKCDLYLPDYENQELILRDQFEELEVQV